MSLCKDEATFIARAAALADTGLFETMSDLHSVLRSLWPRDAGYWLADDVWHCLARRCEAARNHTGFSSAGVSL